MRDSLTATPIVSFQEIQSEWLVLLAQCSVNTIFLLPQWQEIWWDVFSDGREMAGFYLRQSANGQPGARLASVGQLADAQPAELMGIASLSRQGPALTLLGNTETFDYNDFMIRPGSEADFFDALLSRLEREEWTTLELPSLIETSPTLERLPELAEQRGYQVEIAAEDVTPGLELPATWDEYLAGLSKKNRHELRRKLRRLDMVENWRWHWAQTPAEVASRLDDFLALMRLSDPEKADYMTADREAFFRRMAQRTAELDLLRLFFLEIDGQDVAAALCFDYNGVRFLYNSGYNPEFGYYSVGLLLNALCLRQAIELGQGYFDFLRGPEPYKYHLGGQNRQIYRMVISKPRPVSDN